MIYNIISILTCTVVSVPRKSVVTATPVRSLGVCTIPVLFITAVGGRGRTLVDIYKQTSKIVIY